MAGSTLKVWTGSAWAAKPMKVWTGSAWVTKPVRRWDGSQWVPTGAAPPPFSRVQGVNKNDATGTGFTSYSATLTLPVTSGSTVVVSFGFSTGPTPSVTDDKGNTYTVVQYGTDSYSIGLAYCLNITNQPQTITLNTSSSATYPSLIIEEFAGVISYDKSSKGVYPSAVATLSSGSITPANDGSLLVSGGWASAAGPLSIASPLNYSQQAGTFGNVTDGYGIQTTKAAVAAIWTPPTADKGISTIAAFAAGPPSATAPTSHLCTAFTPGADRNDYSGEVGVQLTMSGDATITWLGRIATNGNTGLHTIRVYTWSPYTLVYETQINMTGAAVGTWVWKKIPVLSLVNGGVYAVMYVATNGGQNWSEFSSTTFVAPVSTAYGAYNSGTPGVGTSGSQYVGLDLGW